MNSFDHISVLKFTVTDGTKIGDTEIITPMVALFNSNYLTAEDAMHIIQNDEASDYLAVMPESLWHGLFHNWGPDKFFPFALS